MSAFRIYWFHSIYNEADRVSELSQIFIQNASRNVQYRSVTFYSQFSLESKIVQFYYSSFFTITMKSFLFPSIRDKSAFFSIVSNRLLIVDTHFFQHHATEFILVDWIIQANFTGTTRKSMEPSIVRQKMFIITIKYTEPLPSSKYTVNKVWVESTVGKTGTISTMIKIGIMSNVPLVYNKSSFFDGMLVNLRRPRESISFTPHLPCPQ